MKLALCIVVLTVFSDSVLSESLHTEGVEKQKCVQECKAFSKFRLRIGSTYVYDYKADTVTTVIGTNNETSQILLSAEAHLSVLSPCEISLQLQNVLLKESVPYGDLEETEEQVEFQSGLEKNALKFAFQDGIINKICPSQDEPVWVLNIKRGILSALQNSMNEKSSYTHLYEVDVSGYCETIYKSVGDEDNYIHVKKQKNLLSCSGHRKPSAELSGVFTKNKAKSLPIIKSEQLCEQYISHSGYLHRTSCNESHTFVPFSGKHSGVSTRISQILTLQNIIETPSVSTDDSVTWKTGLQYDYNLDTNQDSVNSSDVTNILDKINSILKDGITTEIPDLSSLVVTKLGGLDQNTLFKLFVKYKGTGVQNLLLNAIIRVGTSQSMTAIQELYKHQHITEDDFNNWLSSLVLHKNPTLEILNSLVPLLDNHFYTKSVLAVSSLLHSYCLLDGECVKHKEVHSVMEKIEGKLTNACAVLTDEDRHNVIVALKAVGNAGVLIHPLETLSDCYKNAQNPIEVRLSAISAVRRFTCNRIDKLGISDMFVDNQQDTELRIAAFLIATQCPGVLLTDNIKNVLYTENVTQVTSFVWTHLKTLQNRMNDKGIQEILESDLLIKYKPENMKLSQNYEISAFSDIFNTGAIMDSNIVFSPHSYLPRSASLNMSLDMFGEVFNIFEIGARMEGFEYYLDSLLSEKKGMDIQDTFPLKNFLLGSQDDRNKNTIKKNSYEYYSKEQLNRNPKGLLYTRIFGNEVYLKQFPSQGTENANLRNQQVPNSKKNSVINYSNSFDFLNYKYEISTIVGVPLKVVLNGNAVVGLNLDKKIEMNFSEKDFSGELSLFVNPSGVVQLEAFMGIDVKVTQAGVKSISTLQSNTYLDLSIQLKNKELIRVSVNVPRNQMDIINISSKIYAIHKSISTELKGTEDNVYSWDTCSGTRVPTLTGMRLCSQFSLRNSNTFFDSPYFSLTGPFTYALNLQKSDSFEVYNFQVKNMLKDDNGRNLREVAVEFDTPGSILDRKIQAKCTVDTKNNSLAIILRSPNIQLNMNGKLDNNRFDKGLSVTFSNNGKEIILLKTLLKMAEDKKYNRYESSLRVYIQQFIDIDVDGHVSWIGDTKYSTALRISGLSRNPIKFSGDVNKKNGNYDMYLEMKSQLLDAKLRGNLKKKTSLFTTKSLIQYSVNKNQLRSVDFALNLQKSYIRPFNKYHLIFKVQAHEPTQYKTKLIWDLVTGESYVRCNTELKFGDNFWTSHQLYQFTDNNDARSFNLELSLTSPPNNIDYKFDFSYFVTDTSFLSHVLGQLSKVKRYMAQFDYKYSSASNRSLAIEIENPQYGVNLKSQLFSLKENEFSGNISLKFGNIIKPTEISSWIIFKINNTNEDGEQKVYGEIFYPLLSQDSIKFNFGEKRIGENQYNWIMVNIRSKTYQFEYNSTNDIRQTYIERSLQYNDGTYEASGYFSRKNSNATLQVKVKLEKVFFFIFQRMDDILESLLKVHFFWDYTDDNSKNIKLEFERQLSELRTYIVTPGHCARVSVSQFYERTSSVNITVHWGKSEKELFKTVSLITLWITDLPKVVTNVVLKTPFTGFEHQAFSLDILIPMNNYYASFLTQLEWQNHTSNIQGVAEYYEGVMKCQLQTNCPLLSLKQMNLHVYNQYDTSDNGISINTNVQVNFNGNKDFILRSFLFTAEEKNSIEFEILESKESYKIVTGKFFSNKGCFNAETSLGHDKNITLFCTYNFPSLFGLLVQTTFEEYKLISLEYFGQINETDILSFVQTTWNNHVTSFNLSGSLSKSSVVGKLDFILVLPDKVESASLSINHTNTDITVSDCVHISFGNSSSKRDLLYFYLYLDNSKKLSLSLKTPAHIISGDLTYTVLYSQQLQVWNNINTNFIGSWNENKCNISAHVKHSLPEISGEINLLSTGMKDTLCVSFSHYKYTSNEYTTSLKIPYDIIIQHKLIIKNIFNWSNSFQITSPMENIHILNKQEIVNDTMYSHTSMFTINGQTYSIEIFSDISKDSHKTLNLPYTIESIMYLTVPWRDPIKVGGTLFIDKISITKKVKMEAYIVFKQYEVVHLLTELKYNRIEGSVDLAMKFPTDKQISLTGGYNMLHTEKTFFLFCDYGGKDLSLQGTYNSFNLNSILKINSSKIGNILNIDFTRYSDYQKKDLKFLLEFLNVKYFEFILMEIYDSQIYETNFEAIIPLGNWDSLTGHALCDWDNKVFKLNFTRKKDNLSIHGLMSQSLAKISGNLSVDYIFNRVSNRHLVEYIFIQDAINDNLAGQKTYFSSILYKSKQVYYSAHYKIIIDKGKSYMADILLHSPFSALSNISVTADINMKNNLEFKIKGQQENWTVQLNGSVVAEKSNTKLNKIAKICLLYPNENITATVEYENISDLDRYVISVNTTTAGIKIVSHIQNKNVFIVEYGMKTPFKNFETINGSSLLSVKENLRFENTLYTKNENFSFIFSHTNKEKGNTESRLNILTPFKGFENIIGYLGHRITNNSQYITSFIYVKNQSDSQVKVDNFYLSVTTFVLNSLEGPDMFVNITLPSKTSHVNMYGSYYASKNQMKFLFMLQDTSEYQPFVYVDLYINNSAINLITLTPATGYDMLSVVYKSESNRKLLTFAGNFNDFIWFNSTAFLQSHNESTIKVGFDVFSNIHEWEQLKSIMVYNNYNENVLSLPLTNNVNTDIRQGYSVKVVYDLNGKEGKVESELLYGDNDIIFKLLSPIKGIENITLTGSVNKIHKVLGFYIDRNGMKSNFEVSVKELNSSAILTLSTPINGFEHFETNLYYKGLIVKGNKDRKMSILILNNNICLLNSSLNLYLGSNNKTGISFELATVFDLNYTSEFYVIASGHVRSGKIRFIRWNHTVLDWNFSFSGTPLLSDININMQLIKPTSVIRFSLALNYDLLSKDKSVFIQINDTSGVPYTLTGKFFVSKLASGVIITSSNMFRSFALQAQYNVSKQIEITSLLSVDEINYIDLQIHITSLRKAKIYFYVTHVFTESSKFSLLTEHDFYKPDKHVFFNVNSASHAFSCSVNLIWPTALGYTLHTSIFNSSGSFTLIEMTKLSARFDLNIGTIKLMSANFTLFGKEFLEIELLLPESTYFHKFSIHYNLLEKTKIISLYSYRKLNGNISIDIHIDDSSGLLNLQRLNERDYLLTERDYSKINLRDQLQISYSFTELFESRAVLELTSGGVFKIGMSLAKNMTGKAILSVSGLLNDSEKIYNILNMYSETKLKGNSYFLHWNVSAYDEEYRLYGNLDLPHALRYMNANIKWPSQTYNSIEGNLNYTLTNSKNDTFSLSIAGNSLSFPSILLTRKENLLSIQYRDQENNILVKVSKNRKYNILFLSNNVYENTPVNLKAVMIWDCNFDSINNANHNSEKSLQYLMKNVCTESENHLNINGLTDEPINISYLHTGTATMLVFKASYLYGEKISWTVDIITDKEKFVETLTELSLTDYAITNVKLLVTHNRERMCATVGARGIYNKYIEYSKCRTKNSGSTEIHYNLKFPKSIQIGLTKQFHNVQNTNITKLNFNTNHNSLIVENSVVTRINGLTANASIVLNDIKYNAGFETKYLSKNNFSVGAFVQGPNNKYDLICENKDVSSEGVYAGIVRLTEFQKGSMTRNVSKKYEIATGNSDIKNSILQMWNGISKHFNMQVFQNVTYNSDTYRNIIKLQVNNMLKKEFYNIQQKYKLYSYK